MVGPVLSVFVTMLAAFALSKRFLPGRKTILFFFMIPMFIGGTIISNYVVIAKLDLLNNFLVYVLPGAFGFFSMVIMRTHIEELPGELQESATIDGGLRPHLLPDHPAALHADHRRVRVLLGRRQLAGLLHQSDLRHGPFLKHLAIRALRDHQPRGSQHADRFHQDDRRAAAQADVDGEQYRADPEVIKMTVMVVVTFPLLFVYPFFQKYFVKGMLTGAVKA